MGNGGKVEEDEKGGKAGTAGEGEKGKVWGGGVDRTQRLTAGGSGGRVAVGVGLLSPEAPGGGG